MRAIREQYFAVMIGIPKQHIPYLMLGEDRRTPKLFQTKQEAKAKCPEGCRVVKVTITA